MDYLVDNLKKTLYLEKEESVPVYELLSVVAAQYNMTAEHYCEVRSRAPPHADKSCATVHRGDSRRRRVCCCCLQESALVTSPAVRRQPPCGLVLLEERWDYCCSA